MRKTRKTTDSNIGLVWGADAIGQALGLSPRQTFHLLERGLIPAKKVGARWCASRQGLHRYFNTTQTKSMVG